jgi:hypothetical protein
MAELRNRNGLAWNGRLQPDDVRNSGAQYRGFRIAGKLGFRYPHTVYPTLTGHCGPSRLRKCGGNHCARYTACLHQGFNFCADIASQRGIYLFNHERRIIRQREMTHQRGYFHRRQLRIHRPTVAVNHPYAGITAIMHFKGHINCMPHLRQAYPRVVGSREIIGNDENARLSDSLFHHHSRLFYDNNDYIQSQLIKCEQAQVINHSNKL